MKLSKFGLALVIILLLITLIPSIYGEITYGGSQWMWGFIFGGLPWSIYPLGIGFFTTNLTTSIVSLTGIALSYLLNICILYFMGYGIEKLYKRYFP